MPGEAFRHGFFGEAFLYYLQRNLSMAIVEDFHGKIARLTRFTGGIPLLLYPYPWWKYALTW